MVNFTPAYLTAKAGWVKAGKTVGIVILMPA